MTLQDYLALITSEFVNQPIFIATLTANLVGPIQVQNLLQSMIPAFDVDTAVGSQLDILGQWVGITRKVKVPITGVYFSWDGTDPFVGWDYGIWQGNLTPSAVTVLPDEAYRSLIKAKIAANQWDGTTDGAYAIWDALFPDIIILINDHQDMTYDLILIGSTIDSLTVALITGGYIPLKPEGVRVAAYYVSTDPGPMFAWDLENDFAQGWDEGSWLRILSPA